MNERIKELMEQASAGACHDVETNTLIGTEIERFAELIVRECMEVCADRGKHHDGLYSAWASDCSERIGKRFGVEK
jgi:hypothetical protein